MPPYHCLGPSKNISICTQNRWKTNQRFWKFSVCVETTWKFAETTNYCLVPCKKIKSLGTCHLPILLRIRDTEWYHNHLLRNSELSEFKFEVSSALFSNKLRKHNAYPDSTPCLCSMWPPTVVQHFGVPLVKWVHSPLCPAPRMVTRAKWCNLCQILRTVPETCLKLNTQCLLFPQQSMTHGICTSKSNMPNIPHISPASSYLWPAPEPVLPSCSGFCFVLFLNLGFTICKIGWVLFDSIYSRGLSILGEKKLEHCLWTLRRDTFCYTPSCIMSIFSMLT